MSRIGRMPITIPAGVEVNVAEGNFVTVKGPKGTLTQQLHPDMVIETEGAEITVKRPTDGKMHRSLHGLTRTLLHNMVVGVTDGFKKTLDVNGVGYRVAMEGGKLVMNLGFSHQVIMEVPQGLTVETPSANQIVVSGFDKLVTARTGIHAVIADEAISCVALGTGKSLADLNSLQDGTMNISRRRQMN